MTSKLFSFIAGAFSSLFWTQLPSVILIFGLVFLSITSLKKWPCFSLAIIGAMWMASVGHWTCAMQLNSADFNQSIQVMGRVEGLNMATSNTRFMLEVASINQQSLLIKRRFRLSWRQPDWLLQDGQLVKLQVKVKPIHGLANQGGFLYQQWLFSEGVIATGYVKSHQHNLLLESNISSRQQRLNQLLAVPDIAHPWLAALSMGYRGMLSQEDWQLVQRTGVAHLIAISGLHLGLVAGVAYFVFAWLSALLISRFDALHTLNIHTAALLLSLIFCGWYAQLAGFGLPVLRALIMLSLFSYFFVRHQRLGAVNLLAIGVTLFILLFPRSLFGASFWLSFSAVMAIWLVMWRWPDRRSGFSMLYAVKSLLRIQLALTVLMIPVTAWQFSHVSLVSPVANLLAIPVVSLILVPACLAAMLLLPMAPSISTLLLQLCSKILDWGITGLNALNQWSWASINLPTIPLSAWMLALAALLWLAMPRWVVKKRYAWVLMLPVVSVFVPKASSSLWHVSIFDVGHGLAVLIEVNRKAVIYDVGAAYPSGFNMADSVLLPYLSSRNLQQVDYVVISHDDNDHVGSLKQLIQGVEVSHILSNQDLCRQGWSLNWQGLELEGLWPDDPNLYNDNDGSCVLSVSDANHRVLLTGDIHASSERKLIAYAKQSLQSTVMTAPHHGSNTSSSAEFIQAVSPQYVVFSQGFKNHWGFPKPAVIERYQQHSEAQILLTSEHGQITFEFDRSGQHSPKVSAYRRDINPVWYANMPACCGK